MACHVANISTFCRLSPKGLRMRMQRKPPKNRARTEKKDLEAYTALLAEARKQGRLLVAELHRHRKQHGC